MELELHRFVARSMYGPREPRRHEYTAGTGGREDAQSGRDKPAGKRGKTWVRKTRSAAFRRIQSAA